ncbi:MAG: DUF1800 domain-containing protein [Saprospiraceae bacterium]
MSQLRIQHLLWRTGFGPATADWSQWANLSEKACWQKIKSDASAAPEYFDVADNAIKGLLMGAGQAGQMQRESLDNEEKKRVRKQSRDDLQTLNIRWLDTMTHSKAQLREKMALFWHGHFASRNINILYQQQLLDITRQQALGNFGELLRAVSKSAAMLAFLNNQQNKKEHPNENFAREVMELFTLGRGNYTEQDVKEAARAFTGWSFRLNGEFFFRRREHDYGSKTILGKTGNFEGEDVLDILLAQPQTARFITRKLYKFLVNEEKIPENRINDLADGFFKSGYDITQLLDAIVGSSWFYDAENTGAKIKSPIELWVGMRRAMPFEMENPENQVLLQKALGQVLLFPPNVAGWPGGKTWIDSSSLMLRLRLPQMIAFQGDLDLRTKTDDDQQMGEMEGMRNRQKRFAAKTDWQPVLNRFKGIPDKDLIPQIARALWQTPVATPPLSVLERHTDPSSREKQIETAFVQLMATPEYQLC